MKKIMIYLLLVLSIVSFAKTEPFSINKITEKVSDDTNKSENIIYNQLGDGSDLGHYRGAQYYGETGFMTGFNCEIAGQFTISETAEISGIKFYGEYNNADTEKYPLIVEFHADEDGSPSEESLFISGTTPVDVAPGINPTLLTVDLLENHTLAAGTYWISIKWDFLYSTPAKQGWIYPRTTITNNSLYYWRNPPGGYGHDTVFIPSTVYPGYQEDLAFALLSPPTSVGPGVPLDPTPAASTNNIDQNGSLTWNNPDGTLYNELYFGTDKELVSSMNPSVRVLDGSVSTIFSNYDFSDLAQGTTYYWKVVETDDDDFSEGDVWSFTTKITGAFTWDFEDNIQGWTIGNSATSWQYEGDTGTPSSGSKFLFIDSNIPGQGTITEGLAVSPIIDLSGYTSGITMSYNSYFAIYYEAEFKVGFTTDGGANWTVLKDINDYEEWTTDLIAIPNEALTATTQFGFWYHGTYDWFAGIDDVAILPPPTVIPQNTTYISPQDNASNIYANGKLKWNETELVAGYKVYLGTEDTSMDLVADIQFGNELEYEYSRLEASTTYYWQVIPYNLIGDAENCSIWSFTTNTSQWTGASISPLVINVEIEPGQTATENITISAGDIYLNYFGKINFDSTFERNISINKNVEKSKNDVLNSDEIVKKATKSKDTWDLQFAYDVTTLSGGVIGQAGCESDGVYIYTAIWESSDILKYDLYGKYIETFQIEGVSNLRDLAYDGEYFYGSDVSTSIYKMDFNSKTLEGIISSPTEIRAIAYDDENDGFWVNNWSSDMICVGKNGLVLDEIQGIPSCYGAAYDNFTEGGPYLWLNTGATVSSPAVLEQFSIENHASTGFTFQVGNSNAGGAFIQENIIDGTVTIAAIAQGEALYGYELCTIENWLSITNAEGNIPAGGTETVTLDFNTSAWENIQKDTVIVKTANITFEDLTGNLFETPVEITFTVNTEVDIDNDQLSIDNYQLKQNYPNPFNPMTKINYELGITNYELAEIVVYNAMGQMVWSSQLSQLTSSISFDGSKLNSGVYYYSLVVDGKKMDTKSMILIK